MSIQSHLDNLFNELDAMIGDVIDEEVGENEAEIMFQAVQSELRAQHAEIAALAQHHGNQRGFHPLRSW